MQKSDKDEIKKLKEGISKMETAITMAQSDGNKVAEMAARKCLEGFLKKLKLLKEK
jgi:hypothetical protein